MLLFQSTFAELRFVEDGKFGKFRKKTCVFVRTLRSGRPLLMGKMGKMGVFGDVEGLFPASGMTAVFIIFRSN